MHRSFGRTFRPSRVWFHHTISAVIILRVTSTLSDCRFSDALGEPVRFVEKLAFNSFQKPNHMTFKYTRLSLTLALVLTVGTTIVRGSRFRSVPAVSDDFQVGSKSPHCVPGRACEPLHPRDDDPCSLAPNCEYRWDSTCHCAPEIIESSQAIFHQVARRRTSSGHE